MGKSYAPSAVHTLNDGTTLPLVGFGTYLLNGTAGVEVMKSAVAQGYQLLDSAFNYENEGALGEAVRKCGVPREDLRIVSKLPGRHHDYDQARYTIEESVYRAGLDYFDMYLIHWPNPRVNKYVEAWRALIDAKDRGLVRSIGVCNFLPDHLERIIGETAVVPSVNQVELHPYFPQTKLRAVHEELGILTESWSPLGRASALLSDPVVDSIATTHHRTIPQVILRWHLQLGALPLPKSAHAQRQSENLELFDFTLTDDEMARITDLGRPDGRTYDQDPAVFEEF
ncbi:aldo/keto reductase [Mycolicibacterium fortuitum]|nr:aldo/keto reductase [Mycolicibacterium fortuitum]